MDYQIRGTGRKRYIEVITADEPLGSEQAALDLVALCWEHGIYALLIHFAALSADFFSLKTKVAGDMIQKFVNYEIKVSAVIPAQAMEKGRFREMAQEANKGSHFRLYGTKAEAETWLIG